MDVSLHFAQFCTALHILAQFCTAMHRLAGCCTSLFRDLINYMYNSLIGSLTTLVDWHKLIYYACNIGNVISHARPMSSTTTPPLAAPRLHTILFTTLQTAFTTLIHTCLLSTCGLLLHLLSHQPAWHYYHLGFLSQAVASVINSPTPSAQGKISAQSKTFTTPTAFIYSSTTALTNAPTSFIDHV